MLAGMYRLKRLGISMTHPAGLSAAMNQLPDEAIALAAASHIERELQITPWNLSSNFVACTNQVNFIFAHEISSTLNAGYRQQHTDLS